MILLSEDPDTMAVKSRETDNMKENKKGKNKTRNNILILTLKVAPIVKQRSSLATNLLLLTIVFILFRVFG